MAASPSVIDVKKSFLHSQVRILNATLEPPHDWNRHIPIPGESKLRDKAVQEALQRCQSSQFPVPKCHIEYDYTSLTLEFEQK